MIDIAVIGDIHGSFSDFDVRYFNRSAYHLLLFVGDLATYRSQVGLNVARRMAQLVKPAYFIPGNHDTTTLWQLVAEIRQNPFLMNVSQVGQARRTQALERALGTVMFAGYSTHWLAVGDDALDVVAARPYSMGGPVLTFKSQLRRQYGIDTLSASAQRLQKCINMTRSDQIVFLSHNGPTGLGASRTDIWGCDFKEEEGDYGDPDLEQAIAYACHQGKRVLAVVAGHMHHILHKGGRREWVVVQDGIHYVNAARVPRIFEAGGAKRHHHVRLVLNDGDVKVTEVVV